MPSALRGRVPRVAAKLALAAMGLLLAVLVLESALRVVAYSRRLETSLNARARWIVYDPILLRKNEPGFVHEDLGFRINSLGYRGDEVSREKPPGTIRIVCLGDSTTFGVYKRGPGDLRASAAYPLELARVLRDAGDSQVEVINAGVLGYTSSAALMLLLVKVAPLEPDVLILRVGNNDHSRLHGEASPLATDLEWTFARYLPARFLDWEIVRLGFHAYRRWLSRQEWATNGRQVPPERFEKSLRRFVEVGRAIGAHVMLLDFPYRELALGESPGETFPNEFQEAASLAELHRIHDEYQAMTARVAHETGTPYVRTVEALRAASAPAFSAWDLSHPNEEGARVIGERVFDELERLGWIGSPLACDLSSSTDAAGDLRRLSAK